MRTCEHCGASVDGNAYVLETLRYSIVKWNEDIKKLVVRMDRGEIDYCVVKCANCGQELDLELDWY